MGAGQPGRMFGTQACKKRNWGTGFVRPESAVGRVLNIVQLIISPWRYINP